MAIAGLLHYWRVLNMGKKRQQQQQQQQQEQQLLEQQRQQSHQLCHEFEEPAVEIPYQARYRGFAVARLTYRSLQSWLLMLAHNAANLCPPCA